jgi:hypothetical protein
MSVGSVGSVGSVSDLQKPEPQPAAKQPAAESPAVKVSISPEAQKLTGGDVDHDGDSH